MNLRTASSALAATFLVAIALTPTRAFADTEPVTLKGKAILEHPAGKVIIEAGRLLKAGKAAEVRKNASKEVREEWAVMSPAEQKEEAARLQERAPEPAAFEADIARVGEMIVDGESARLSIPTPSGDVSAMAFASIEGGKWRIDRGPMTLQVAEPETAPAIRGAAILDHELGKLALDYAGKLAAGKLDAALDLVSATGREHRAALAPDERQQSDDYRKRSLPKPALLAEQIRGGGELTFTAGKATLMVLSISTTTNADGSVTSTSESLGLGFREDSGKWRIAE